MISLGYRCCWTGCRAEAVGIPKLYVPRPGDPETADKAFVVILDSPLCLPHMREAGPWLALGDDAFVEGARAHAEEVAGPLDFERSWLVAVALDSPEHREVAGAAVS